MLLSAVLRKCCISLLQLGAIKVFTGVFSEIGEAVRLELCHLKSASLM